MTNRRLGAVTVGLLAGSLATFALATARAQDATVLPGKGPVTLVGCLVSGDGENYGSPGQHSPGKHQHGHYVLANATAGPATSVTDASCSDTGGQTIKLERMKNLDLNGVNAGQWVEVSGKLEKNQHEMHVKAFHAVPVVVPRAAEARPEAPSYMPPQPAPTVEAPAPPAPIATTGVEKKARRLPKTASQLPLIELVGLLGFAGGLALLVDRRRVTGRT